MGLLSDLLDLCVEEGLVSAAESERLAAYHERQYRHPLRLLVESGIDEEALYSLLAREAGVEYRSSLPETDLSGEEWPVAASALAELELLPFGYESGVFTAATWRWDRRIALEAALTTLAGREARLVLIPPGLYDEGTQSEKGE